jgi:hypothetical protein
VGELEAAVTKTEVKALGSATGMVVGSARPDDLALDSIDPTESPAGPPDNLVITIVGAGFDVNTRASFGVFSKEDEEAGLGEEGQPKWEATTRYQGPGQLALSVTAGLFPNPDPAIPIFVGAPDGTTAGPVNFAFTAQEETDG